VKDSVFREKVYGVYLDFFKSAETKRRWNIFDDIPWDLLDAERADPQTILAVEHACTEEMYLPDYGAKVMPLLRASFGHAWFWANWTYEESMHALALREYLVRSGHYSIATMTAFEERLYSLEWQMPFDTLRQMSFYGGLQETATHLAYKLMRERAVAAGDRVLDKIFWLIGRDEASHAGFYRKLMTIELERDRAGTLADMAHVIPRFKMPGDGLVPDYHERLVAAGLPDDSVWYMSQVVVPTLKAAGITWEELRAHSRKAQRSRAS
jgi:acyl-[acyl-carrier-protein] desaturase